jgi:ArsR family transcriptional regulator, arsenate/arsenite/antimonite-responsive transcriptional repressor
MEVNMDSEQLLKSLSALADRSRFHILQIMAKGTIGTCCDRIEAYENGCCVADVVTVTGLSQPTVSHHLKTLEQVGLIRKEIRGPWACYFPNADALNELMSGLKLELYPGTGCDIDAKGECSR